MSAPPRVWYDGRWYPLRATALGTVYIVATRPGSSGDGSDERGGRQQSGRNGGGGGGTTARDVEEMVYVSRLDEVKRDARNRALFEDAGNGPIRPEVLAAIAAAATPPPPTRNRGASARGGRASAAETKVRTPPQVLGKKRPGAVVIDLVTDSGSGGSRRGGSGGAIVVVGRGALSGSPQPVATTLFAARAGGTGVAPAPSGDGGGGGGGGGSGRRTERKQRPKTRRRTVSPPPATPVRHTSAGSPRESPDERRRRAQAVATAWADVAQVFARVYAGRLDENDIDAAQEAALAIYDRLTDPAIRRTSSRYVAAHELIAAAFGSLEVALLNLAQIPDLTVERIRRDFTDYVNRRQAVEEKSEEGGGGGGGRGRAGSPAVGDFLNTERQLQIQFYELARTVDLQTRGFLPQAPKASESGRPGGGGGGGQERKKSGDRSGGGGGGGGGERKSREDIAIALSTPPPPLPSSSSSSSSTVAPPSSPASVVAPDAVFHETAIAPIDGARHVGNRADAPVTVADIDARVRRNFDAFAARQLADLERRRNEATPENALPPGTRVGPWRLDVLLGAGSFGEVYRATPIGDSAATNAVIAANPRAVALKLIRQGRSGRGGVERDELIELSLQTELGRTQRHPNLVETRGSFETRVDVRGGGGGGGGGGQRSSPAGGRFTVVVLPLAVGDLSDWLDDRRTHPTNSWLRLLQDVGEQQQQQQQQREADTQHRPERKRERKEDEKKQRRVEETKGFDVDAFADKRLEAAAVELRRLTFVEENLRAIAQLVCGLDRLHANGFAHRDLKPRNVLVRADTGALALSDFGQSRMDHARVPTVSGLRSFGTRVYRGPEECCGRTPPGVLLQSGGDRDANDQAERAVERATMRDDAWPLGIVACQLFFDVHPFNVAEVKRLPDESFALWAERDCTVRLAQIRHVVGWPAEARAHLYRPTGRGAVTCRGLFDRYATPQKTPSELQDAILGARAAQWRAFYGGSDEYEPPPPPPPGAAAVERREGGRERGSGGDGGERKEEKKRGGRPATTPPRTTTGRRAPPPSSSSSSSAAAPPAPERRKMWDSLWRFIHRCFELDPTRRAFDDVHRDLLRHHACAVAAIQSRGVQHLQPVHFANHPYGRPPMTQAEATRELAEHMWRRLSRLHPRPAQTFEDADTRSTHTQHAAQMWRAAVRDLAGKALEDTYPLWSGRGGSADVYRDESQRTQTEAAETAIFDLLDHDVWQDYLGPLRSVVVK